MPVKTNEHKAEVTRLWRLKHKDELTAKRTIYYEANRDKLTAYNRAYHHEPKTKSRRKERAKEPAVIERRRQLQRIKRETCKPEVNGKQCGLLR